MSKSIDNKLYEIIKDEYSTINILGDWVPMPFLCRRYLDWISVQTFNPKEMREAIELIQEISSRDSEDICKILNEESKKKFGSLLEDFYYIYSKEKSLEMVFEFINNCLLNFKAANSLFAECLDSTDPDFTYDIEEIRNIWMEAIRLNWKIQASEVYPEFSDEGKDSEEKLKDLIATHPKIFSKNYLDDGVFNYKGNIPI